MILSTFQIGILIAFFLIAMIHHGKTSYRQGRVNGTNEGIEQTLAILTAKGIININEAEEILRQE